MPKGYAGGVFANDAPEIADISVGFIAVESCSSIVVAHEKGLFKKHGLNSKLTKESSWAAARDKLQSGENHGTHLKYAQAVASTAGALGAQKFPILVPYTLSRNGSIFMYSAQLGSKLTFDPKSWKAMVAELKGKGEPFTLALPAPMGWHGLMYRHFLASGGVNADAEMKVITLPPAQMVQNMKVGTMHACALVEPWGARGIQEKITRIAMYGHEMWTDHPTKSFSVTEKFANENPKTVTAMLRAIHEAATWCDDFGNREELAKMLTPPTYLNTPIKAVLPGFMGELDWGDGRKQTSRENAICFARDNYPQPREVKWFLANFRRWGMIEGDPDYAAMTAQVSRPEFLTAALKDLGATEQKANDEPIKFWDGTVFEHAKAAEYAKSFEIHGLKG